MRSAVVTGLLHKRYVYVVDKADVAHLREVVISNELDDTFTMEQGLAAGDTIIVDGVQQVEDGDQVKYENLRSKEAVATRR